MLRSDASSNNPGGIIGEIKPMITKIEESSADSRVLNLLCDISKKVSQEPESTKLINQILLMASKNLKCAAASIFLIDDCTGDLYFEAVIGNASQSITNARPRIKHGIAYWVAQHGYPLIVNDVSKDIRFNKTIDLQTTFKTRSVICVPLTVGQNTIGVIEVLNKVDGTSFTTTDQDILSALASTAALAIDNAKLQKTILEGYENTIHALAAAIDAKDPYTFGHSKRVTEYALMGAEALSLSSTELKTLEYAGILHDIGKIVVDDAILRKTETLNQEEIEIIQSHPIAGANIVAEVPYLNPARDLIAQHHEKYDGSGYPFGLSGEKISLGARILTIADTFDALTTDRPYRKACDIEAAVEELKKCKGIHFCPVALDSFLFGLSHYRPKDT
jgi:putative nucleotidyltransferase with HDIG domain